MVDVSSIAAAIGSLRAANDIAQAMIGLRDAAVFQSKLIEFQAKIIEANNNAFAAQDERAALLQKISDLEKQVAALEAERSQMHRYQLKDFGGNTFAYELKESESRGEPIHRACATCYQKRQISILQFSHSTDNQDWYDCPACKKSMHFGQRVRRERGPIRAEYF